jgi:hypothetical protein
MPKLNKKIKIQKAGILRIVWIDEKLGISPEKFPPFPNRTKTIPIITEPIPTKNKILRQTNQWRSISATSGVNTKLKFGASS